MNRRARQGAYHDDSADVLNRSRLWVRLRYAVRKESYECILTRDNRWLPVWTLRNDTLLHLGDLASRHPDVDAARFFAARFEVRRDASQRIGMRELGYRDVSVGIWV